jgi:hypothetical protein
VIDGVDFWTQLAAGVVAGLILLFAQAFWLRDPAGPPTRRQPSAGPGNQATVTDNTVGTGGIHIHQSDDHSSHTTIVNNLYRSPGGRESTGPDGLPVGLIAAAIAAALLFVLFRPWLMAATIGAAVALVIMTGVAIRRSRRLGVWTTRAGSVCVAVATAVATVVGTWWGAATLERDGLSLDALRASIPNLTTEQAEHGFAGIVCFVFQNVLPVLFTGNAAPFVSFLMLGAAMAAMLVVLCWSEVLGWHAFLRFHRGVQRDARIGARAKGFSEGAGVGVVLGSILLAAIAIACVAGVPFDLISSHLVRGAGAVRP